MALRSTRRTLCALALTAAAALAPVQSSLARSPSSAPAGPCDRPVRPASQMAVEPCDTPARIIDKAARIVPTKGQLAWQQREVTAFTHFGMNTFTDREWGSGAEDEKLFRPSRIDVGQWMRAYKAAGAEQVMLTAKHHDGFVLYPSRYTPHSVAASPGSPDVVGAYVKAARRAGLKVGIYLSPSDGAELPHAWHARWVAEIRKKQQEGIPLSLPERVALEDGDRAPRGLGRFGNGSEVTERTIPTLVPGDDRAAAVRSGALPAFRVRADDYDAYFLNQVYELADGRARALDLRPDRDRRGHPARPAGRAVHRPGADRWHLDDARARHHHRAPADPRAPMAGDRGRRTGRRRGVPWAGPGGTGHAAPQPGRRRLSPRGRRLCHPGRAGRRGVRYVDFVSNKVNKNVLRAGTITAGTALMLLMSSPAFALTRDDGDDPGPGLSVIETLGLFVALPIVLFLVIAGLVMVGDKSPKKAGSKA